MTDTADPRAFVLAFLRAFEDLDLPRFVDCFADDARVFFPAPEPPHRLEGKAAIAERFGRVFASIRAAATSGPPWHRLEPQGLEVQALATDVAVASFELRSPERIARRTLVLVRGAPGWRIAHLHASNAASATGPA